VSGCHRNWVFCRGGLRLGKSAGILGTEGFYNKIHVDNTDKIQAVASSRQAAESMEMPEHVSRPAVCVYRVLSTLPDVEQLHSYLLFCEAPGPELAPGWPVVGHALPLEDKTVFGMRANLVAHGTSCPIVIRRAADGSVSSIYISVPGSSTILFAWGDGTSRMSVADVQQIVWTAAGQPNRNYAVGQQAADLLAEGVGPRTALGRAAAAHAV
jgi:hypothetical protein